MKGKTVMEEEGIRKQLLALVKVGDPVFPVVIERGGPRYMVQLFVDSDPDTIRWFGLDVEKLDLIKLSYERIVHADTLEVTHVWRNEKDPDKVFVKYIQRNVEASQSLQDAVGFDRLIQLSPSELREQAVRSRIGYYMGESRSVLAMLLYAPVPQDPNCPQCAVPIGKPHQRGCPIKICRKTGKYMQSCTSEHYHGWSRWTGYEHGVLESFVYSVTPEVIRTNGVWDRAERVFQYDPFEEPVHDIDETVVEEPPNEEELRNNVTAMLSSLGEQAKAKAMDDNTAREAGEVAGIGFDITKERTGEDGVRVIDEVRLHGTSITPGPGIFDQQ